MLEVILFVSVAVAAESCRHGAVALAGGQSEYEGRVEVCVMDMWHTVCRDNYWGLSDAIVICKQLGFWELNNDMSPFSHEYSGHPPGTGHILTKVECLTTERRLIECNYKSYNNCTHKMDAGVQCMDGGTPTGVLYDRHNSSLFLSWNASTGGFEDLQYYRVTCSGVADIAPGIALSVPLVDQVMPRHSVQVLVGTSTTTAHLQGLYLTELSYQCCVYADYNTYSPRACVFINDTNEMDASDAFTEIAYTNSSIATDDVTAETHSSTAGSASTVGDITVEQNNGRQSATTDVLAIGITLGVSILFLVVLSLVSWICTCHLYCKQNGIIMNKGHQRPCENSLEASNFDNILYEHDTTAVATQLAETQAISNEVDSSKEKSEYEMVDLPSQESRRSMVKSRYEFSEIFQPEINPSERYEFCGLLEQEGTEAGQERPGNIISSEDTNTYAGIRCKTENSSGGAYENLQLDEKGGKKVNLTLPQLLPLPVRRDGGDEPEGEYSVTFSKEEDQASVYSHTYLQSDSRDDHSYSHVWIPQNNKPSPGYLHLDTNSPRLAASSGAETKLLGNSSVKYTDVIMKGYSHLDISEMTSPVIVVHEETPTSSPSSSAYQTLDATREKLNSNTYASLNKSISSYSSLNIDEIVNSSTELINSVTDGYSHLDISEAER